MSDTPIDKRRGISRHMNPEKPTLSGDISNHPINVAQSNHRVIAYLFEPNFEGYIDVHRRYSKPPELPHMTIRFSHTNAPEEANIRGQGRTEMTIEYCTRHSLPGGGSYNVPGQDDWSLWINDPDDFGPLSMACTTCLSSLQPNLPYT